MIRSSHVTKLAIFLALATGPVIDTFAQISGTKPDSSPAEFLALTTGFIACPEEQDIVELADVEQDAPAFLVLHIKKIYDGRCTRRMETFELNLVTNVKHKETPSKKGRYACFNSSILGEVSKKRDCGLASYVKTKRELIAARTGAHRVVEGAAEFAVAECTEGGVARAFRKDKTWRSTGVFEDTFNTGKNSAVDAIRRESATNALTDACRGMSR